MSRNSGSLKSLRGPATSAARAAEAAAAGAAETAGAAEVAEAAEAAKAGGDAAAGGSAAGPAGAGVCACTQAAARHKGAAAQHRFARLNGRRSCLRFNIATLEFCAPAREAVL
jgi:hypothetical protein